MYGEEEEEEKMKGCWHAKEMQGDLTCQRERERVSGRVRRWGVGDVMPQDVMLPFVLMDQHLYWCII